MENVLGQQRSPLQWIIRISLLRPLHSLWETLTISNQDLQRAWTMPFCLPLSGTLFSDGEPGWPHMLVLVLMSYFAAGRYGGGPAISRSLISMGVQEVKMVEVYPLMLLLCRKSSGEQKSVSASRMVHSCKPPPCSPSRPSLLHCYLAQATVGGLKELARTAFGIEQTQPLTLWDHFDPNAAKLLSEESQTLSDAGLQTGQQVRTTT